MKIRISRPLFQGMQSGETGRKFAETRALLENLSSSWDAISIVAFGGANTIGWQRSDAPYS